MLYHINLSSYISDPNPGVIFVIFWSSVVRIQLWVVLSAGNMTLPFGYSVLMSMLKIIINFVCVFSVRPLKLEASIRFSVENK